MELENILSHKNQLLACGIKEFDRVYLYKCKIIFSKSLHTRCRIHVCYFSQVQLIYFIFGSRKWSDKTIIYFDKLVLDLVHLLIIQKLTLGQIASGWRKMVWNMIPPMILKNEVLKYIKNIEMKLGQVDL